MSNIVLSGANTALAYKLKRLMATDSILMGDFSPLPVLPGASNLFVTLPSPESATYIHDFLKFCLSADVSRVYVIRRAEAVLLYAAQALFAEYGIVIVLPHLPDWSNIPVFDAHLSKEISLKPDGFYWRNASGTEFLLIAD